MLNEEFSKRAKALRTFIESGDRSLKRFQTGGYRPHRNESPGSKKRSPAQASPEAEETLGEEIGVAAKVLEKMGLRSSEALKLAKQAVTQRRARTVEEIVRAGLDIYSINK